jgi:hypothetical protein
VMVGSVHAISEMVEVVVLSRTGSQMGPYWRRARCYG